MTSLHYAARSWPRLLIGATLFATLALAGCNRADEPATAGERIDAAAAKAADTLDAAGKRLEDSTAAAKDALEQAADATSTAMTDAGITVAIKARLADDTALKVLDIGVETNAGHAQLTGTAPDAVARDRATQLAAAVDGVTSVDNQLTIPN